MTPGVVSIMGPPASGKTTLAANLCELLGAELIREDYEGNPFLAESYAGDACARLPAQLYFLVSRVSQLSRAGCDNGGLVVSDYAWCQDIIFARLRLCPEDLGCYEPLARRLGRIVRAPDVLISLDADTSTLLDRLVSRGRSFERVMDESFFNDMRRSCIHAARQAPCPVISVNSAGVDFRRLDNCRDIADEIRMHLDAASIQTQTLPLP